MKVRRAPTGFTLIELMIVVTILGILAAVAIPSMVMYVRRSKTAEAYGQIRAMFNHAAVYYARDRTESGIVASTMTACTVGAANNKVVPTPNKTTADYSDSAFQALGFRSGPSYFRLELDNLDGSARCNVGARSELYLLRARGDLDGDGLGSTIELATGSNGDNELYHASGFFVENETE